MCVDLRLLFVCVDLDLDFVCVSLILQFTSKSIFKFKSLGDQFENEFECATFQE